MAEPTQYSTLPLSTWDSASVDASDAETTASGTTASGQVSQQVSVQTSVQTPGQPSGSSFIEVIEVIEVIEASEEALCEGEGLNAEPKGWSEPAEAAEVNAGAVDRPGKKKVTYYLSESVQNQLKVRATIEGLAMSEVVEQALRFYLEHGDLVKRDGVGHTHRLYACPACQSMLMFRHDRLQSVPRALESGIVLREPMS